MFFYIQKSLFAIVKNKYLPSQSNIPKPNSFAKSILCLLEHSLMLETPTSYCNIDRSDIKSRYNGYLSRFILKRSYFVHEFVDFFFQLEVEDCEKENRESL